MLQTLKEKEFFQTRRTKRRLLKAKAIRRRKRQELKEKEMFAYKRRMSNYL